jgi:DEAD/DEAH box helicase domain-containing protein
VAGEDALDQWLMSHPREVFTRMPEPAVVNLRNPFVLDPHLVCAAYERPLSPDDALLWDEDSLDDGVLAGVRNDRLVVRDSRAVYAGRDLPAAQVGLRTGTAGEYRIVDADGHLIGTVDESRAFDSIHPGAIYLHQGQHYRVDKLDLGDRAAWVVPTDGGEWTQVRSITDISVVDEERQAPVGSAILTLGSVEVAQQVVGYQRRRAGTGELLGTEDLELPATRLRTRAFWYVVPAAAVHASGIAQHQLPGSLHAAEHAGIGILPLFTICDRWDVGGVSTAVHVQTGEATIFIYDGYPGGAGIAELGFAAGRGHLQATVDVITECRCERGCPSCVHSPKCGNGNEPLDKSGAIALLRAVLSA